MSSLAGTTAIVTGASRGIGAAAAAALAAAGARVGIIARDEAAATGTASAIGEATGLPTAARAADVAEPESLRVAITELAGQLGAPSILVNNAGAIDRSPAEELTEESWRRILDTNLGAAATAATTVLPLMRELGGGSIVNITSLSAHLGVRQAASYGASKTALLGLTRALALEWAPHRIRVNAVTPGYIDTTFTRPLVDGERAGPLLERIPLGRWGRPEDVAGAIVYLASPTSAYVTGQTIVVDGGFSVDG